MITMPPPRAASSETAPELFRPALASLRRHFQATLHAVPEAVHAFLTGGKYLRPQFLFACATPKASPPTDERLVRAAAAIQLVHAACLLHDDIVDRCEERRGRPAFHASHGARAAVETGTYLVHLALELVSKLPAFVRRRTAEVARVVARSELTEMARTFDVSIRTDERLLVMEEKTASVFALACEVGSFLSSHSARERTAAKEYGTAFGLLYQIADDLDDLFGTDEDLGRRPGADLREGVLSLPLVYGLEGSLRLELIGMLEDVRVHGADDSAVENMRMLLSRSGALDHVETLSFRLANRARDHLRALPRTGGTAWLIATLEGTILRIRERLEPRSARPADRSRA